MISCGPSLVPIHSVELGAETPVPVLGHLKGAVLREGRAVLLAKFRGESEVESQSEY